MEQTCIRNDGVVYNNVLNSAVISVDSVTNKRMVYHFSKTSVANTLPMEGSIVTVATKSRNEITAAYDDGISIEDDEYTGLPKLPVHKTIMPLPVTSSYGGVRSIYECPVQATTSQVVNLLILILVKNKHLNCINKIFISFLLLIGLFCWCALYVA